jgi:cytochrome c biogenesis protein CcmG/thiol:disulfide interchange protein DsbE
VSGRTFAVFMGALAVLGLLGFGLISKGDSRIATGEQVPSPTLPRLDGRGEGSLADYRGGWVLVNIWASWCGPCREEAPALQEFQRRYGGPDFTVLGIDTRDLTGDGRSFVRRFGLTYPQLRDADGDAASELGATGVPESFLVDPEGNLALARLGPLDETYLRRYVAPLIEERD